MKKKSQFSIGIHWIFILIAGAVILTFFVSVVVKQKAVSEQKIAGTAITGLEQIFTAAGVTQDTLNKIEIPKLKLEFICKDNYSEYSIKNTGINRNLGASIVFSPSLVKGDSILIWTLPWNMPFKIDNFMMITSPEVRYIIIYDSSEKDKADIIFEDLPEQISKEIISLSSLNNIKDKGNYKIKLVFISQSDSGFFQKDFLPAWMKKQDVSALRIADNYIMFYEKQGTALVKSDKFSIRNLFPETAKNPMIYSAIFAENSEMYDCAMKKAFKRLAIVSDIYKKRTESLNSFYNSNIISPDYAVCASIYSNLPYFEDLKTAALTYNINNIIQPATEIATQNRIILEDIDCPLIY